MLNLVKPSGVWIYLKICFDHYYVKPALAKTRKAALDAKLTAAGKPLSK
jgi:hypothetical protein